MYKVPYWCLLPPALPCKLAENIEVSLLLSIITQ